MGINLEFKKNKVSASYKTIYLKNETIDKLNEIAKENDTSFNNIIVNMIDYCIKEGFSSK